VVIVGVATRGTGGHISEPKWVRSHARHPWFGSRTGHVELSDRAHRCGLQHHAPEQTTVVLWTDETLRAIHLNGPTEPLSCRVPVCSPLLEPTLFALAQWLCGLDENGFVPTDLSLTSEQLGLEWESSNGRRFRLRPAIPVSSPSATCDRIHEARRDCRR